MSLTPFDTVAQSYDEVFDDNKITQAIRPIIVKSALRYFTPGSHILELNCGTGTDAIMLAKNGIEVTATDASKEMIALVEKKLLNTESQQPVHPMVLSFDGIHTIPHQQFDGVFSNFGGLNCTPNIDQVIKDISLVIKPGGIFICCLLNRFCLWETTSFLIRGKLKQAARRFTSHDVKASVGNSMIPIWYYSPKQFIQLLSPYFNTLDLNGLSILSPSPNSRTFSEDHPNLLLSLLQLDEHIRHFWPFNSLGDHFLIIAQKRQ